MSICLRLRLLPLLLLKSLLDGPPLALHFEQQRPFLLPARQLPVGLGINLGLSCFSCFLCPLLDFLGRLFRGGVERPDLPPERRLRLRLAIIVGPAVIGNGFGGRSVAVIGVGICIGTGGIGSSFVGIGSFVGIAFGFFRLPLGLFVVFLVPRGISPGADLAGIGASTAELSPTFSLKCQPTNLALAWLGLADTK